MTEQTHALELTAEETAAIAALIYVCSAEGILELARQGDGTLGIALDSALVKLAQVEALHCDDDSAESGLVIGAFIADLDQRRAAERDGRV